MTAEIIDFQEYRDRKLRQREMSEPIPEAEIQPRQQSHKVIGEPGNDGGDDDAHGDDTA